jgi:hypothetical protein
VRGLGDNGGFVVFPALRLVRLLLMGLSLFRGDDPTHEWRQILNVNDVPDLASNVPSCTERLGNIFFFVWASKVDSHT